MPDLPMVARMAQALRRCAHGRPCLLPSTPLTKPSALIVARDPMTGALIGSLVEVSGFRPVFPATTEDTAHAIARLRPNVVLVDCDAGDEERCIEPVAEYGGAVVMFSPWRPEAEVRSIASRHSLDYFTLPIHWIEFRRLLRTALGQGEDA
jgi:hypothetical protein